MSNRAIVDATSSTRSIADGRLSDLAADLRPAETLGLIAVGLTPLALLADYRLGLAPVVDTISFRPLVENGALPVIYQQLVGWTQILWISIGVAALSQRATRRGFRSASTLLLAAFCVFLIVVTAASGGVDRFAAVALFATLAPLVGMLGVLTHPDVRRRTVDVMVAYLATASAVVVLLTVAKNVLHHQISGRLAVFLYGSPTYAAAAFAALLFLVLGVEILGRNIRLALAATLAVGIVLTQTRGGTAALAGGFLAIGLMRRKVRLPALAVAAVAGVVLIASPLRPLADTSNAIRTKDVMHHARVFLDRPVTGFGISNVHANAFRAADNTLVGIADAAGVVGLLLWCGVWLWPVVRARRWHTDATVSFAVGAIAATFVSWLTTGNEVLIYAPPTNLLPLALSVSMLGVVAERREPEGETPSSSQRSRMPFRRPAFSLIVGAALGAGLAVGVTLLLMQTRGDPRARARAAAQGIALSSCGSCRVQSLSEVTSGLWLARLAYPKLKPSPCFYITLGDYYPMPPGILPPGISWVRCPSP